MCPIILTQVSVVTYVISKFDKIHVSVTLKLLQQNSGMFFMQISSYEYKYVIRISLELSLILYIVCEKKLNRQSYTHQSSLCPIENETFSSLECSIKNEMFAKMETTTSLPFHLS